MFDFLSEVQQCFGGSISNFALHVEHVLRVAVLVRGGDVGEVAEVGIYPILTWNPQTPTAARFDNMIVTQGYTNAPF